MGVLKITAHHEGAGVSRDANLAYAGYSASVFKGGSRLWRSPYESWATRHFNHVSFDIVFPGNFMSEPLTDELVLRFADVVHKGVGLGWVSKDAYLDPHGTLYAAACGHGSDPTQCPGTHIANGFFKLCKATRTILGGVTAPAPSGPYHPVLRIGDHGTAVKELQSKLNRGTGTHLVVDGAFGPMTQQAVFNIQRFFRLDVDGVVGPKTWGAVDVAFNQNH